MTAPTRPVMRYHGGKWRIAPWIIEHFPPHSNYVELFGGAGSVLMRKRPCRVEIYNDLDDQIANVFRVLRDPRTAEELERVVRLTPFARAELELSYETTDDPIERARRMLARSALGFGGGTQGHRTGFRRVTTRSRNQAAEAWASYPDQVCAFTARLRHCVIEQTDAVKLIEATDSPETLFYADPPYVHSTRTRVQNRSGGSVYAYEHEYSDADHRRLARALARIRGMAVVSGYPSPLYERLFTSRGWTSVSRRAIADGGAARTEVLWLNPSCMAALRRSA